MYKNKINVLCTYVYCFKMYNVSDKDRCIRTKILIIKKKKQKT